MKRVQKINSVLVFLVIIGTIFANLNAVVSIMPRNTMERDVKKVDNQTINTNTNEFDLKTLTEISNYIRIQADLNNFEISIMVYSSGLLFESDTSLIIIGHGYFDSKNQYFISDYSTNRIIRMAENKEVVALLSCYSSNIRIENNKLLTYNDKIDIESAMKDLFSLLDWTETYEFNPTRNFYLIELDPGGPGGDDDDDLSDATIFVDGLRYAHSYLNGHLYWNLYYDSAIESLTNFMLNHKYRLVEFTFTGDFLIEQGHNTGIYELEYHTITYDAWCSIKSDTKTYVEIDDVKYDGVSKGKYYSIKADDLLEVLADNAGQAGFLSTSMSLAAIFATIGGALIAAWAIFKVAARATAGFAPLTKLCGILAIIAVSIAIILAISVWIVSICWI